MRLYLVFLSLVLAAYAIGACAGKLDLVQSPKIPNSMSSIACDPDIYDAVYRGIIQSAIDSDLGSKAFKARNDGIETLELLCRGQKSRY